MAILLSEGLEIDNLCARKVKRTCHFNLLRSAIWGGKLVFAGIDSNAAGESLLHLVNLPFHEAGHVIFRPFGRFMTSLGGTLGQLLIPLVCLAILLLKSRDPFGAAVCLWWFGENFLDIAPYLNDARAGVLPLLGAIPGKGLRTDFTIGNLFSPKRGCYGSARHWLKRLISAGRY